MAAIAGKGGAVVSADEMRRCLEAFDPGEDARARSSRDAVLALVEGTSDPGARSLFTPGHVTASALVLSDDGGAVLLVLHARLRRWLQPGGHLEPSDGSLVDAARREVREETGLVVGGTEPALVGVDVHDIPAARGEPSHRHYDLMFGFVSPRHLPAPGRGVLRAEWCPLGTLGNLGVDDVLRRAVARARGLRR
jgi:8-oxo-dGTP pyrophosphatase MutT (NUDIX family)